VTPYDGAVTSENVCPACGPVKTEATSRYCPRHTDELRAAYQRLIARKRATGRAA
jgi:hypothetical protein